MKNCGKASILPDLLMGVAACAGSPIWRSPLFYIGNIDIYIRNALVGVLI